MNSIKLTFKIANAEQCDLLTALLSDLHLDGTEQNDEEFIAYFPENTFNEFEVNDRIQSLHIPYSKEIIEMKNWNATWEANFEPILINNEVGVRAHFHPPFTDCKYDIVITPKMSFGTGHHETTQMMLNYLCEIDCEQKSVFDFGCGTGVLAILAKLKGASHTIGIDNDPWSVENGNENCLKNNCSSIEISDKTLHEVEGTFDIILANINLNVLMETLPRLYEMLNNKGDLYLSGILISDLDTISERLSGLNFEIISQKQLKNWLSLHIKKRNA